MFCSSVFGNTTSSGTGGGLFGSATALTTTASNSGGGGLFGSAPTTSTTTGSGGGGGGLFGGGGGGGLFGGLGGKPNPENVNKNVFGSTSTFGGGSTASSGK